jgi:thiamine-monophosphate kinase
MPKFKFNRFIAKILKLKDLGERKIIDLLETGQHNKEGKDDCALLKTGNSYIMLSTDIITRETHIPEGAKPFLSGKFFAALNLSDIAAMAGIPIGFLVSLSVSPEYDIEYLEEFYRGINFELGKFNASILGGDTKEGYDFTASGTVIGKQVPELIRRRSDIAPGQCLMVTNTLGSAGAGYIFYKYGMNKQLGIQKMLDIEPRINEAIKISQAGARFMMDLSDGVYASIYQMSMDYGIGFKIYGDKIPVDASVKTAASISGFSINDIALSFGGDYELLFTVEKQRMNSFTDAMANAGIAVHCIGETYIGENVIYDGKWIPVNNTGYEHFKKVPLNK